MPYVPRTNDAPGDLGRSVDQNDSVGNDAYFYSRICYAAVVVVTPTISCEIGDGKMYLSIPAGLTGMNLVSCHAYHATAGAGGNPTLVQVHNLTDAQNMLSTRIMVDVGEKDSKDAATPYVIDTTKDDVVTYDVIRIDVPQLPTTAPLGLVVTLGFQFP